MSPAATCISTGQWTLHMPHWSASYTPGHQAVSAALHLQPPDAPPTGLQLARKLTSLTCHSPQPERWPQFSWAVVLFISDIHGYRWALLTTLSNKNRYAVAPLNDHVLERYFACVVSTYFGTLLAPSHIKIQELCFLMHPSGHAHVCISLNKFECHDLYPMFLVGLGPLLTCLALAHAFF